MSRLFAITVLVYLLGSGAGMAQDPTKVEATHYKLGFENEHVQVVYIHYGPHEKSSMHEHPAGVVVNLTNGHLRFTDEHGSVQEVRALHGEARWFPPFKHKVENLSDTAYDGIYIAIKGNNSPSAGAKQDPMIIDQRTEQIVLALARSRR